MIPPKRNNYAGMLIVKNVNEATDLTKNYYAIEDKTLVFNKYKTSKKKNKNNTESYVNNTQLLPIDDELVAILSSYINHPKNKSRVLGILFPDNTKFIFRRLIKMLKLIDPNSNKPIDTLRHSMSTYYNKENISIGERRELAKQMTHSVMMSLYYIKNPKNN